MAAPEAAIQMINVAIGRKTGIHFS